MATEFEVIFSEFSSELDALLEMATSSSAGLTPRARIAAANGATLLLAATFEEYIRQQIRAAFREKTKRAKTIRDFPDKIASVVWRRSLESLARTPFEEVELNGRRTNDRLSATIAFCIKKEIEADVSETISHNDNNMRSGELNRLFNQIGIISVISESCKNRELIKFLGAENAGKANSLLEVKFEQFFRRRNAIAHAIELGKSSGATELVQDIQMFRVFGDALLKTVQNIVAPAPPK